MSQYYFPTQNRAYVLVPPSLKLNKAKRAADHRRSESQPPSKRLKTSEDEPSRRALSPTISEYTYGNSSLFTPPRSRTEVSSTRNTEGSVSLEDWEVNFCTEWQGAIENAKLLVPGESASSDVDPGDESDDDIPVRRLDQFIIFDDRTQGMAHVAELLPEELNNHFSARGMISAWSEEDVDSSDSEDDGENDDRSYSEGESPTTKKCTGVIQLSPILELNVHHASSDDSDKPPDSKIYIRTKHAWYILGTPHLNYMPIFSTFWLPHRVFHLVVVTALQTARIKYQEFLDRIHTIDETHCHATLPCTTDILGRHLKKEDVEAPEVQAYIVAALPEVCGRTSTIQIHRTPLIRHFLGPVDYKIESTSDPTKLPKGKQKKHPSYRQKTSTNVEQNVSNHRLSSKTFLTPIVNQLAEHYFSGSLEAAEHDIPVSAIPTTGAKHKMHKYDPDEIVMGKYLDKAENLYRDIMLDGVKYNVGDVVMVVRDDAVKRNPAETSSNPYANDYWFCQIQYFFRQDQTQEIMFHAQWFNHGAETLLQQTAHPGSLFYLGTCDNLLVSCIFKKTNFVILDIEDPEPSEELESWNSFHCALQYDKATGRFSDIPPDALVTPAPNSGPVCYACKLQTAEGLRCTTVYNDSKSVTHNGVVYHAMEHVYIIPHETGTYTFNIGQIIQFIKTNKGVLAQVRYLERLPGVDERALYLSNREAKIDMSRIDGICYVKHIQDQREIEDWVHLDDNHFYLNQIFSNGQRRPLMREHFIFCTKCHSNHDRSIQQESMYRKQNSKLTGMELFSGAGGLGLGMDLSGVVNTKYAVEYSPSAAATFRHNHPDVTVFCQDTSVLLKRAVQRDAGEKLPPLYNNDGRTVCPDLPSRSANIDFIFGGPPCQSFSRANHHKIRDDPRSTLPPQMISWVEYYRPRYFLLENVAGIHDHRLYFFTDDDNGKSIEVEVRQGMVKFIFRALIALGYQVHYRQLQAAQYGVPQSRTRIIFWGARRGLPLPEFPIPTHGTPKPAQMVTLPSGEKVLPVSRWNGDKGDSHSYAPHKAITVRNAINDLPPFDWKNPGKLVKITAEDRAEIEDRRDRLGIPQFGATNDQWGGRSGPSEMEDLPGYPEGAPYHLPPQNRYQKWLRRGMPESEDEDEDSDDGRRSERPENGMVHGHYTATFGSKVVESTVRIPMKARKYHKDLPAILIPEHVRNVNSKNVKRFLFGRMDGDAQFPCALTKLHPASKNQWPLHPDQRRIISVRECARAQGFPDHYTFKSTSTSPHKVIEDQMRQIGNAVAVPFALALGKELSKVLVQAWEEHQREGSPEL